LGQLLEAARRSTARVINTVITTTYWNVGRRIIEFEQGGEKRAGYGEEIIARLAAGLTAKFGRGFSRVNLGQMKRFYLLWPNNVILQAVPEKSPGEIIQTPSEISSAHPRFALPWSHYVRLMAVKTESARQFYETEALRGGWSVRQLDRQISTLFYERAVLSRDKAAMLTKGAKARLEDRVSAEEALLKHLERFLLELGNDFTFVARQRRLRIGDEWFRVDLLFFHRRLRCLVVIDLKIGKFTHADAGQMHKKN